VRFSDDELARARATVREWRAEHPGGTAAQLVDQVGTRFHPDWVPVLRAMLFVVDRHAARAVTGITGASR
jgi:hypothetical protein